MVVVVIIGLLAALAIPAFQRVRRSSQNSRILNDFRVFSQAFETYSAQNGSWPANGGNGTLPPGMTTADFKFAIWNASTVLGGRWNWDNSRTTAGGGLAGISINSAPGFPITADDAQLAEIDAKIDDGNITTGKLRMTTSTKFTLILEE
jgi:type II secretory pathway pseudopilin PulG